MEKVIKKEIRFSKIQHMWWEGMGAKRYIRLKFLATFVITFPSPAQKID
jgi:hypothetical protein